MQSDALTTGMLARRAGANRETIRFYERSGLLPKPERARNGYRIYRGDDLRRIQFIIRAKSLGFTLRDIAELLAIADGRIVRCAQVKKIAEQRLGYIDSQISDLKRLGRSLHSLIARCGRSRKIKGCPIIEVLSVAEEKHAD